MKVGTYQRFESGEICIEAGWYEFDGYVDGPPDSPPRLDEMQVALGVGDIFPPIQSRQRVCYWTLVGGSAEALPADCESAPNCS